MFDLLAIALASAGPAGPVYLECQLPRNGKPLIIDLAIDEANQQATLGLASGRTATRPALFSPSEVKILDDPETWRISRVDLTLTRTFSFSKDPNAKEVGTCKLKPTPAKRAF